MTEINRNNLVLNKTTKLKINDPRLGEGEASVDTLARVISPFNRIWSGRFTLNFPGEYRFDLKETFAGNFTGWDFRYTASSVNSWQATPPKDINPNNILVVSHDLTLSGWQVVGGPLGPNRDTIKFRRFIKWNPNVGSGAFEEVTSASSPNNNTITFFEIRDRLLL